MKNLMMTFALALILISCKEEDTDPMVIDTSMPQGEFTVEESGMFVAQNETGSKGTVEVGVDAEATSFVKFGSDFETVLATGTVTVFLSTTNEDLNTVFDPGSGNQDVQLIGTISANGEQYFKLASAVDAKFDYVILWCASAGIPFGYAELQ